MKKNKKKYTKPTIDTVPMNMEKSLLAGSDTDGVKATISGYQSSEDDEDESDGFSQDLWN